MGWNGSNLGGAEAPKVEAVKKAPSMGKGLLAGLIVVVLAAAAVWFFCFNSVSMPDPSEAKRPTNKIPEKTPAFTTVTRIPDPIKPTGNKRLDEKIEKINAIDRKVEVKVPAAEVSPEEFEAKAKKSKRVFTSGVEQLMSIMFTTQPGTMPFPLVDIPSDDLENLATILVSKNDFEEDDTDEIKYCKATVQEAKKEMISYIKQGGDPDGFMAFYHDILMKDFNYRNEAMEVAQQAYEEDPALGRDLVKRLNKEFDEQGILRLSLEEVSGGEEGDDALENTPDDYQQGQQIPQQEGETNNETL